MSRPLSIALLALLALPVVACAQDSLSAPIDRSGPRTMEVWAGYSAYSPDVGVLGRRAGMRFAASAVRFGHRVSTRRDREIEFTVDVVPLALMSPPLQDDGNGHGKISQPAPEHCTLANVQCTFPEGSAHGIGVSPLGVTAIYHADRALQWRLGATGGVILFDRRVPTSLSTSANFTASLEAGVQLISHTGRGVLLVYRFHHISNAGFGYDNSALASNVISLGGRWRR